MVNFNKVIFEMVYKYQKDILYKGEGLYITNLKVANVYLQNCTISEGLHKTYSTKTDFNTIHDIN